MKVTDLKEDDCIVCTTQEEADQICKIMHEAGLTWKSGQSYLYKNHGSYLYKNHGNCFNKEIVYYPGGGYCANKKEAEEEGHLIYSATEFLEEPTEDSKYPLYHRKLQAINKIGQCTDLVVLENCIKMMERSIVGMDKYGVGLDRDDYTENQWLTHLEEELMDAINYIGAKRKSQP